MFVRSASLSAKTDRRRNNLFQLIFAIVVSTGPLGGPVAAAAPACPELAGETITWIVPFGAGGGYDIYSRLIEPHLEAALGAQISVVNVEGAGGVVGTKRISEAAGDGRTLGLVNAARTGRVAAARRGNGPQPRDRSHGDRHPDDRRPRLVGPFRRADRLGRGSVPNRPTSGRS